MADSDADAEELMGFPSPARDYAQHSLSLDALIIQHAESTYFWRMEGDAMTQAGIEHGDLLVVDRIIEAQPGYLIIAIVSGTFVVRQWEQDDAGDCLISGHPLVAAIRGPWQTWGVVTHVIHTLNKRKLP